MCRLTCGCSKVEQRCKLFRQSQKLPYYRARIFKLLRSSGIDSASLCSLSGRCRQIGLSYRKLGWESIPGLLKMFTNTGSVICTIPFHQQGEGGPSSTIRQCQSRNSPGFDPSVLRQSGMRGAAGEAVLNNVRRKIKKHLPFSNSMICLCDCICFISK